MSAKKRLQEIGLFCLGRQAGGRAASLSIHHHQRQLGCKCQRNGLAFEGYPRSGTGCDSQGPCKGSTYCSTGSGYLILSLEGDDIKFLVFRERMQQAGSWGDRIGRKHYAYISQLSTSQQTQSQGIRAGDVAILPGCNLRRRNLVDAHIGRQLGRFAIGMTCIQRRNIGLGYVGNRLELAAQRIYGRLPVTVKQPHDQPQGPHILAANGCLVRKPKGLHRLQNLFGNINLQQPIGMERVVCQWIGGIAGSREILLGEGTGIDNNQSALLKFSKTGDESSRIHCDQHIKLVPCCTDFIGAIANLEGRNTEGRSGRRSDFCWKIRKRIQVVAVESGRLSETVTGQLHAVTRVASKAHRYAVYIMLTGLCGHKFLNC